MKHTITEIKVKNNNKTASVKEDHLNIHCIYRAKLQNILSLLFIFSCKMQIKWKELLHKCKILEELLQRTLQIFFGILCKTESTSEPLTPNLLITCFDQ